jgi:hypothetical protein
MQAAVAVAGSPDMTKVGELIRRVLGRTAMPEIHIPHLHDARAQVSNSRRLDEIEARLRLMQAQARTVTARRHEHGNEERGG